MRVSLRRLLQTGRLGDLEPGMTPQQVIDLLGPPEASGGTSRKYKLPSIYKYGCLEVSFSRRSPQSLTGVYVERPFEGDQFDFGETTEVEDWDFAPRTPRSVVQIYLITRSISFEEPASRPNEVIVRVGGSGVQVAIGFDENNELWSIYAG